MNMWGSSVEINGKSYNIHIVNDITFFSNKFPLCVHTLRHILCPGLCGIPLFFWFWWLQLGHPGLHIIFYKIDRKENMKWVMGPKWSGGRQCMYTCLYKRWGCMGPWPCYCGVLCAGGMIRQLTAHRKNCLHRNWPQKLTRQTAAQPQQLWHAFVRVWTCNVVRLSSNEICLPFSFWPDFPVFWCTSICMVFLQTFWNLGTATESEQKKISQTLDFNRAM